MVASKAVGLGGGCHVRKGWETDRNAASDGCWWVEDSIVAGEDQVGAVGGFPTGEMSAMLVDRCYIATG